MRCQCGGECHREGEVFIVGFDGGPDVPAFRCEVCRRLTWEDVMPQEEWDKPNWTKVNRPTGDIPQQDRAKVMSNIERVGNFVREQQGRPPAAPQKVTSMVVCPQCQGPAREIDNGSERKLVCNRCQTVSSPSSRIEEVSPPEGHVVVTVERTDPFYVIVSRGKPSFKRLTNIEEVSDFISGNAFPEDCHITVIRGRRIPVAPKKVVTWQLEEEADGRSERSVREQEAGTEATPEARQDQDPEAVQEGP